MAVLNTAYWPHELHFSCNYSSVPPQIFFSILILGQNRPEHVINVRVAGDRISKNAHNILTGRRQAKMALGGGPYTPYADGRKVNRSQKNSTWDSINCAWVIKQRLFSSTGHLPYMVIHEYYGQGYRKENGRQYLSVCKRHGHTVYRTSYTTNSSGIKRYRQLHVPVTRY